MKSYFIVSVLCFLAGIKGYSSAERVYYNADDRKNVIGAPGHSFEGPHDGLLYLDEEKQEQEISLDESLYEHNGHNGDSDDDNNNNEVREKPFRNPRRKRQANRIASQLAGSHTDNSGRERPVGKVFPKVNVFGSGKNSNNYNAHVGVGAGSVVWRSKNNRHSVGVGGYASQNRGSYQGFSYKTKPDVGAGVGYKFRF